LRARGQRPLSFARRTGEAVVPPPRAPRCRPARGRNLAAVRSCFTWPVRSAGPCGLGPGITLADWCVRGHRPHACPSHNLCGFWASYSVMATIAARAIDRSARNADRLAAFSFLDHRPARPFPGGKPVSAGSSGETPRARLSPPVAACPTYGGSPVRTALLVLGGYLPHIMRLCPPHSLRPLSG